jgi:hypothetical protein
MKGKKVKISLGEGRFIVREGEKGRKFGLIDRMGPKQNRVRLVVVFSTKTLIPVYFYQERVFFIAYNGII